MTPVQWVAAVIALLLALFNLLLAGQALAAARSPLQKVGMATSPAGVCIFAVAWFVSILSPESAGATRVVGGLGGTLAMTALCVDALRTPLPWRTRALLGASATALTGVAAAFFLPHYPHGAAAALPRAVAAAQVVIAVVVHARAWKSRVSAFSGRVAAAAGLASAAFLVPFGIAALRGSFALDPVLWPVLVAETLILVFVVDRKLDADSLLPRGLTYALFSLAVAALSAGAFRALGYPMDPVQVCVTVSVSLLAAVLFMAAADPLTGAFSRLLFPAQARLAGQLAASRGEAALLRRRLEQVERLAVAGELAASVAHEVKNPLAALRGYAQLLAGRSADVEPTFRAQFDKALRIILEESDRIDARVAELLGLVRTRPGSTSTSLLLLNRLVSDVVAITEGEPRCPPLRVHLDAAVGHTAGHEDEIRGALANLLRNAVEATGPGREAITVSTRLEDGRAVVEIVDSGAGLEPSHAAALFRPFHTTKPGGTGLGLSIARSAAEAAGGRVTLEPRKDQRGAVARLELPARSPPPEST